MYFKYNTYIETEAVSNNLKRLTNQIYKLLPSREEGLEWKKPLETIVEELAGMDRLFMSHHDIFFPLLCKLEGLFILTEGNDFQLFRRIIFECLSLLSELQNQCQD